MVSLSFSLLAINHEEETKKYLNSFKDNADKWQDLELKFVDNGSEKSMTEWGIAKENEIIRNDVNVGVVMGMQQIYEQTTSDYIIIVHNDVEMFEKGWDTKLKRILDEVKPGVAGFFGAKGLGTSELYRVPYQMHQLIRIENVSGAYRMPAGHGHRPPRGEWEPVTMMDGFSMIFSRKFLDENGGFDTNLPPHHMYDAHTCLQSLDLGYRNIVISMDCFHHGGMTDVHERWNEPFGMDKAEIHRLAHYPYFYMYWKPGSMQEQHSKKIHLPIYIS